MEEKAKMVNYIASSGVFLWGLTFEQLLGLLGIVTALVSLFLDFYYKRRRDKREAELHQQKLSNEDNR